MSETVGDQFSEEPLAIAIATEGPTVIERYSLPRAQAVILKASDHDITHRRLMSKMAENKASWLLLDNDTMARTRKSWTRGELPA